MDAKLSDMQENQNKWKNFLQCFTTVPFHTKIRNPTSLQSSLSYLLLSLETSKKYYASYIISTYSSMSNVTSVFTINEFIFDLMCCWYICLPASEFPQSLYLDPLFLSPHHRRSHMSWSQTIPNDTLKLFCIQVHNITAATLFCNSLILTWTKSCIFSWRKTSGALVVLRMVSSQFLGIPLFLWLCRFYQ